MIKKIRNCWTSIITNPQLLSILTMVGIGVVASFVTPGIAYADFDPNNAVKSVLSFFQLLILLGAAKIIFEYVGKGHLVPAAITVIAAAFFYVILDPDLMKEIGGGLKSLLKMGGQ